MPNLPDRPDADNIPGSYRLNISDLPNGPYNAVRITRLKDPSEAIIIADGRQGYNRNAWNQVARWEEDRALVRKDFKFNVAWDRHLRRGMYAFADGHAESLLWDDTWAVRGPNIAGTYSFVTMWRHNYEGWPDR